jgi:hypothetical protein
MSLGHIQVVGGFLPVLLGREEYKRFHS